VGKFREAHLEVSLGMIDVDYSAFGMGVYVIHIWLKLPRVGLSRFILSLRIFIRSCTLHTLTSHCMFIYLPRASLPPTYHSYVVIRSKCFGFTQPSISHIFN